MVPISPEIYSSTAVVMDNRGLSDYILRLEDKRARRAAAEQDAVKAFLKDNEKNLDPTGMRIKDVPKFEQGLQDFRQTSIGVIQNPNDFKKRLEVQQKADALRALVAKSKQEKEVGNKYDNFVIEITKNPELRKTVDFEALLKDKANHDLPLGDPNRQEKEFNPNYYKPAPVSIVDLFEKNKAGIELGAAKRISPNDKDYYYEAEQTYTPEGIKVIASRIADRVQNDPNLKSSYQVKGQSLPPEELAKYNVIAKKYFPNMEVDDDDPVSVAIAEALIEGEARKKPTRVFDRKAFATYQSGLISSRQKGADDGLLNYDLLGKYNKAKGQLIDIAKEGKTKEERIVTPTRVVLVKDIPSQDYDLITNKESVFPYTEGGRSYFIVREDGSWEGKGGQVIDQFAVARANLDKTSLSEQRRIEQGILPTKNETPKSSGKKKVYKGVDKNGNPIFE